MRQGVSIVILIVAVLLVVFVVVSDVRFFSSVVSTVSASRHQVDPVDVAKQEVPAPDTGAADSRTSGYPACTSDDVAIELKAPDANTPSGGTATLTATIRHVSQQTCFLDASEDSLALVITTEGGSPVYDSSKCNAKYRPLLMGEDAVETYEVAWPTVVQVEECVTSPDAAGHVTSGLYYARLQDAEDDALASDQASVMVVGEAPSPTASASADSSQADSGTGDDAGADGDQAVAD